MTISERFEKAKPYLVGFVVGIILTPIVAFSAGWVVTTGSMEESVYRAKVEQLASICASQAEETWLAQNASLEDLEGWQNRDKREEVVGTVLAGMTVPESLTSDVTDDCEDALS